MWGGVGCSKTTRGGMRNGRDCKLLGGLRYGGAVARPLPLLVCDLPLCAARSVSLGSAAQYVRSAGRKHDLILLFVRPPLATCDATTVNVA